jgi:hypothetical protein
MWPNGNKGVRSKDPAWGNRFRAAWTPPFLSVWLFLVLALSGCATAPGFVEEGKKPEPLRLPVILKAVPRRVLVAPRDVVIWLWNHPGGTTSGSVRVGKLPSGTEGFLVAFEPVSESREVWHQLGLGDPRRTSVAWVKVLTPRGEGWVRTEFVEPR